MSSSPAITLAVVWIVIISSTIYCLRRLLYHRRR